MKIIGIGLQKGGVGKTSVCLAIAAELAKTKKVLVVDADPQGNASATLLKELQYELADVLDDKIQITKAILQTDNDNLFILPTKNIDTNLRAFKGSTKVTEERYLFDDEIKKVSQFFDYCLIDTSPDFSAFEKNCFLSCDEIIPIVNCTTYSMDGLTIFFDNIQKFEKAYRVKTSINKVVINNYNASMSVDNAIKNMITQNSAYQYFIIPQDQDFKKSQMLQRSLNGKLATTQAIKKLAEAL